MEMPRHHGTIYCVTYIYIYISSTMHGYLVCTILGQCCNDVIRGYKKWSCSEVNHLTETRVQNYLKVKKQVGHYEP